MVQTRQTQNYHIWTRLLLMQKRHTLKHQQYQWNRQNAKKKCKKSTYQRIRSQTQICQTHHRANLIILMTENVKTKEANKANKKSNEVIKIKSITNEQKNTRQTHSRATLIRPTKVIIKSRDAIKRIAFGKGNLSNYVKN